MNASKALQRSVFKTTKPLNKEEGSNLLRNLMTLWQSTNQTSSSTSSTSLRIYQSTQKEKETHYNCQRSQVPQEDEDYMWK